MFARLPGRPRRWLALALCGDGEFWRRLVVAGGGNAAGRALGLLFTLALAALFLPADYGYLRWAMSVGMLAGIPAAAGTPALARALGAASGQPGRQRGLAAVGLAQIAIASVVCALLAAVVLHALGRPAAGVVAVVLGMTLFMGVFNVYRGLADAWRLAALYVGGNLLQLVVVLLLCGPLGLKLPDLVLVVYGFAWVVVLLLLERRRLGWLVASARESLCSTDRASASRELRGLWLPLIMAQASYTVWTWADVVVVERLLGAGAAGEYGLAKSIATVFLLLPEAVTIVLLPYVAGRGRAAGGLTMRLLALSTAASLLLLAVILAVVPPALTWLAAGRYAAAALALPGVAIGMAVYALYQVLEGHVVGLGRARAHAVSVTLMAAVMLLAMLVLVPLLGQGGAGLAYTLAAAAGLLMLVILARRTPSVEETR